MTTEAAVDRRLAALDRRQLRDTRAEPALEALVRFAARLCGTTAASVNLLDRDSVHTIASVGLDGPMPLALVRRTVAFGSLTAAIDPQGELPDQPWRFHVGIPLIDEGLAIGTLAVLDTQPHDALSELQADGLRLLADQVALGFARKQVKIEAQQAATTSVLDESQVRIVIDAIPQIVWSTRPDGHHDFFNARWYEFTGTPPRSTNGEGWADLFHPDDQDTMWRRWSHSLETGEPYAIEYRLRARDGAWRWVLGRALALRDEDERIVRWFGTCTDIDEQRRLADERDIVSQELSHRIKNIFSIISGLLGFSARGRPEVADFASELRQRILALGRAHDFVRPHSQYSEPPHATDRLHGLIHEMMTPYGEERFTVVGDNPAIDDRSATPLALLVHELATNAAKYGALSSPTGCIRVAIEEDDTTIRMHWTETGGPPVAVDPDHEGFGTRLIELSVVRQLHATVEREWRADGLTLLLSAPKEALFRAPKTPGRPT